MIKSDLGKKNSAKRKIQIRKYYEEQKEKQNKSYSDPFLSGEIEESTEINLPEQIFLKTKIKKSQIEEEEEEEISDDILIGDINLDEADFFISSLKIPKRKKKILNENENNKIISFTPVDTQIFKKETDSLKILKEKEIIGHEEEEEGIL